MKLISKNDLIKMRQIRDRLTKEFSEFEIKVSDKDFVEKVYPFILDSIDPTLYDLFMDLDCNKEKIKSTNKVDKPKRFYRGNPIE